MAADENSGGFSGDNLVKLALPVLQWNALGFPIALDSENALSWFGHDRDNVDSLADASASAARYQRWQQC